MLGAFLETNFCGCLLFVVVVTGCCLLMVFVVVVCCLLLLNVSVAVVVC